MIEQNPMKSSSKCGGFILNFRNILVLLFFRFYGDFDVRFASIHFRLVDFRSRSHRFQLAFTCNQ